MIERRGPTRDVMIALLERGARGDKTFFADREKVQAFADSLEHADAERKRSSRRRAPGAQHRHRGSQWRISEAPPPRSRLS